jgi:large subunit ribosomal protein L19
MDHLIRAIERDFKKKKEEIPDFRPGDLIRVYERVSEGARERLQAFEGVVLKRSGGGLNEMFTVRKLSSGIGVEKIFPLHSPKIDRIEIVKRGKVRQARPYYLRKRRQMK